MTPILLLALAALAAADDAPRLEPMDVFELEWASDPRIAPDGETIVYVRRFMDVTTDRRRGNLWLVHRDGTRHRALTTGLRDDAQPRWSPAGDRLAWVATEGDDTQVWVRWMDTGQTARLTNLTRAPSHLTWSPAGRMLAFTMFVPDEREPFAELPEPPEGAEWAEPPVVIDELLYRADGRGYTEPGRVQLFVLPSDGGTPRQLTDGPYDVQGPPTWDPDGQALLFASNRREGADLDPVESEIYAVALADGAVTQLTDRDGPDVAPAVSPDGETVAYVGFDDREQGYQVMALHLMNRDGSEPRVLTADLDRSIDAHVWDPLGRGLFVQYDDHGNGKIAFWALDGRSKIHTGSVGGTSIGRPYSGGSFSLSDEGYFAFTLGRPDRPADVGLGHPGSGNRRLTTLNEDLLGHRALGLVNEIRFPSSADGREIQGWYVTPPGFDPERRYPLILEIHGGPFANYGDRWSTEVQLYAAAGYVVLYVNPRGSTSYGEAFGNLIHHAYPGEDYDDLMSGVDALIARGFVDPERLFVTGGSGGGVLSAWIVGKTDRFRAAVVAKPVINWASFALTADAYPFFWKYWFPGYPWDAYEAYWRRSPLSLAGNVETPTMLLTGEEDYRTPISESEQFYQALKLREVDAALVRIPGASHGIAARPSHLIAKVAHVLEWFARHGGTER